MRLIVMHVIAIAGFVGGLFGLSLLVNGTGKALIEKTLGANRFSAISRYPAMLRLPVSHAIRSILNRESQNSDSSDSPRDSIGRFNIGNSASDFSRGLNLTAVPRVESQGFNYALILPSSLAPASDGASVATQIIDHSVSTLMKQDGIKNSFVGKAATTVEETMRADVNFGGSAPNSIKHNIKFQIKATDAKAKMEYSGLTNAEVSYSVANRHVEVEVFEPLSAESKIVFSHSNRPNESQDLLSLRVNW